MVGEAVIGAAVGSGVGLWEGGTVGPGVGRPVGPGVGRAVGVFVGWSVGRWVGLADDDVGAVVGFSVGLSRPAFSAKNTIAARPRTVAEYRTERRWPFQ